MDLKKLKEKFNKWLELEDDKVIDVILATVVANRFAGDSINVHIVAPPSSAKTELLRTLFDLDDVYPMSKLTAHTFASGLRNQGVHENSLLIRLQKQRKKIVVLKDFTTVLEMRSEERQEVFSQIREIADGDFRSDHGSGSEDKPWKGKLGVLTGVTSVIDKQYALRQALGERFLHYRIASIDPHQAAELSSRNAGHEDEMRKELAGAVSKFMEKFDAPDLDSVGAGSITHEMLINLATLVATARTGISRDRANQALHYIPEPESPPRLMKYLLKLGRALALVQGKKRTDIAVYDILRKIGRDTLPSYRNLALHGLSKSIDRWETLGAFSIRLKHPQATMRLYLEELQVLKLVDSKEDVDGEVGRPANVYKLSERGQELVRASMIYPDVG